MRFTGKVVLVSGAANGIGRATAMRFAQEGADVVAIDREGDPLREVAHAMEGLGRRVLAVTADWTDAARVHATFAKVREIFGRVDILFNNVGQSARERASEFYLSEEETWRFVVDVSLLATMRATREVVGEMRTRRSGKIVNMSS